MPVNGPLTGIAVDSTAILLSFSSIAVETTLIHRRQGISPLYAQDTPSSCANQGTFLKGDNQKKKRKSFKIQEEKIINK